MKLGARGTQALKTLHLVAVVMWMGGLITWVPLIHGLSGVQAGGAEMYLHLRAIALNVIGWGGIFSFVSGVALGSLSHWGLFRQLWTAAKLVLTLSCIPFGMFFIEATMLDGLRTASGGAPVESNLGTLKWSVALQLGAFAAMIVLAVFKPRRFGRGRSVADAVG